MPLGDDSDILGALLGASAGTGDSYEPGAAGDASLLKAVASSPFYRGVPSQSGAGQISEAILPLLAGLIEGRQAEQQAKNEALVNQVKMLGTVAEIAKLQKSLKPVDLEGMAKVAKALGLEPTGLEQTSTGQVMPKYGRAKSPSLSTNNVIAQRLEEELGRPPTAAELDTAIRDRKVADQARSIQSVQQAAENKRVGLPAKPPTGGRYFDPMTMKPVAAGVTQGEVEAGNYPSLPDVEGRFVRTALNAFDALNKSDAAARKLLVPSTGSATDIGSVVANQARLAKLRAQGDPDAKLFDSMQNLEVFAVARIGQGISDRLSNVDQALAASSIAGSGDTQQSALQKNDHIRQILVNTLTDMGFDPETVQARASGRTALSAHGNAPGSDTKPFNLEIPPDLMPAASKLVDSLILRGASDEEIRVQLEALKRNAR